MALIAEEVVEEWLNQQGFFTIRGIKLGVDEMDILAIRQGSVGWDLRHYEVQASVNPVSYITAVPKQVQRDEGRSPGSAKLRSSAELQAGVDEWIDKKFLNRRKSLLRRRLFDGEWSFHFVIGEVRHSAELAAFESSHVEVIRLSSVIADLRNGQLGEFKASGKDLCDLIAMGAICTSEPTRE